MKLISMSPVGGDSPDAIATVEVPRTIFQRLTGTKAARLQYRGHHDTWWGYPSGRQIYTCWMLLWLDAAYRREIEWKDHEARMSPVSFPFLNRSFDEWAKISATLETYRIEDATHLEEIIRLAQGIP